MADDHEFAGTALEQEAAAAFELRKARNDSAWLGGMIVAAGLGIFAMVGFDQTGLDAPLWVMVIVGAVFVLIGFSFLLQGFGFNRLAPVAGLVAMAGLSVPGLWIGGSAVGASCSASFGFVTFSISGWSCGLVFGIGGAVTLGLAVLMAFAFISHTVAVRLKQTLAEK